MAIGRRNATVPAQYDIDQAAEESSGRLVQQTVGKELEQGCNILLVHFWCGLARRIDRARLYLARGEGGGGWGAVAPPPRLETRQSDHNALGSVISVPQIRETISSLTPLFKTVLGTALQVFPGMVLIK